MIVSASLKAVDCEAWESWAMDWEVAELIFGNRGRGADVGAQESTNGSYIIFLQLLHPLRTSNLHIINHIHSNPVGINCQTTPGNLTVLLGQTIEFKAISEVVIYDDNKLENIINFSAMKCVFMSMPILEKSASMTTYSRRLTLWSLLWNCFGNILFPLLLSVLLRWLVPKFYHSVLTSVYSSYKYVWYVFPILKGTFAATKPLYSIPLPMEDEAKLES